MLISERKRFFLMALVWNWILGWFQWNVLAQVQRDCDYKYTLKFGDQQILQNPGFDQGMYYARNKVCRWAYSSPPGTVFDVTCNPIDMPGSESGNNQCQYDRLVVSLTGNPTMTDGRNFCGQNQQPIKLQSVSNALTIGLVTDPRSPGGRYRCIITPIVRGGVPPTTTTTTTTTARPNTCDCGWRQQRRIVGGTETKVNEYVFMAAMIDMDRKILWCGATIISTRYAVTAAHCIVQRASTNYGLLVGDHSLSQGQETQSAKLHLIEDFNVHESYNSRTQENDIAIIRTTTPIEFNMNVGPICLPYRYTNVDFSGAVVTALGWGSVYYTGPTSDTLQAVNLTIVNKQRCQSAYTEPNQIIFNTQICSYQTGKDSCTFDSGGPLAWFDNFNTFRFQLLGVISYGQACATDAPAVNTRVPSYVSWILNETPDASYCFK